MKASWKPKVIQFSLFALTLFAFSVTAAEIAGGAQHVSPDKKEIEAGRKYRGDKKGNTL